MTFPIAINFFFIFAVPGVFLNVKNKNLGIETKKIIQGFF